MRVQNTVFNSDNIQKSDMTVSIRRGDQYVVDVGGVESRHCCHQQCQQCQ